MTGENSSAVCIDWKSIPGFDGYQASRCGLVRSLRSRSPVILKTEIDKDGYLRFQPMVDGKQSHLSIHRAVALAFHGLPPDGENVACHNDGNPSNNCANNIRWASQKSNIADKALHGTHQVGSKHPRSICNESSALSAKKMLREGLSLQEVATALGLTRHIIADISRGRTWVHVDCS